MSRGHPGRQCQVEGCARSGTVYVELDSPQHTVAYVHPALDGAELEELFVCRRHAERLGAVEGLSMFEAARVGTRDSVMIDPKLAVGWQLKVTVRDSGRWAVVLEEPQEEGTEHE